MSPIEPSNIPPLKIVAPLTIGDKGAPSQSIVKDAKRVFHLIEDERHLVAHTLYEDVVARLDDWKYEREEEGRNDTHKKSRRLFRNRKEIERREKEDAVFFEVQKLFDARKAEIEKLKNRCRLFRKAQQNLNIDDTWKFASQHFGITTYYRREEDESLSIKLEGDISGIPLFEQLAVFRDVDLHHDWVPFCTSSMTIADLDKLDLVGWFMTGVPQLGLARDGCFRVIGCDNMSVDDTVIVTGQGIQDRKPHHTPPADTYLADDPIMSQLKIPPVPTKRGNDRMTVRNIEAVIRVTSPTTCSTRLVANVDPNIPFLSQGIIDFGMKHLAGVMLSKLQGAAKKIVKNPVTNHHAIRMRQQSDFYRKWLVAKFQAVCDEKGWDLPAVSAFAVSDEELWENRHHIERKIRKLNTFGGVAHEQEAVSLETTSFTSAPNMHNHSDDSVSAITSNSHTSFLTSNPLSKKLRKRKEKKARDKAARVAKSRERVATMIRPHQLSFEQKERLVELKRAKQRRLRPSVSVRRDSVVQKFNFWQRTATKMTLHGRTTRFLVTAFFVVALFVALHPSLLMKDVWTKPNTAEKSFWVQVLWDVGTALYILVCGVFHFLTCYVALIYAFAALDLGSKAGRQVKAHYGENVHLGAGLCSLGIMGFSIAKGILQVYARKSLWYSAQGYSLARDALSGSLQFVPPSLLSPLESAVALVAWCVSVGASIFRYVILSPGEMARKYLLQSNAIGRLLDATASTLFDSIASVFQGAVAVLHEWATVHSTGERMGHDIWRRDSFLTAKNLYSYTAIFLVITLILFNIFARSVRSDDDDDDDGTAGGSVDKVNGSPPPQAEYMALALSSTESSPPTRNNDSPQVITRERPMGQQVSDISTSSDVRRRRLLAAFRRKRTRSSEKLGEERNSSTTPADNIDLVRSQSF